MEVAIGTLIIRSVAFILWVILGVRVLRSDQPVSGLARRIIITMIWFGLGCLLVGALVPFGFPSQLATFLYTAFASYSGVLALVLLTSGEPNGHH